MDEGTCQSCGMRVGPVNTFHPYLFCVLFKAGIKDPRAWLTMAEWTYTLGQSRIPETVWRGEPQFAGPQFAGGR